MRKYLFAAAAAGGVLLLGAAPAQADDRPAPGLLGGLLDPAGGILPTDGLNVDNPVGDAPLADVEPGDNTPSVAPTLPAEGTTPAARTGLGSAGQADGRPAADEPAAPAAAATSAPATRPRAAAAEVRPVARAVRGLLPDGRVSGAADTRESDLLGGDLPLLGGLPGEPRTLPADAGDPDVSGMPAGGSDVPPAAAPGSAPAPASPAPAQDDGDEAGGRAFSDGRPVAGTDPDYR